MKYLWDMHKISCSVSWEEQSFSPVTTALRGDAHWNSHRLVKKYGNNGQKSIYALAWSTNVPEWIFKKPQALWLLFVKNARTHLHENNLTDCLVAHTRSYTCGLMDEHCLHTWCSFLLHIECLVSCCMWQKTSNRNRCIVPRRKVTDLHPEVLPAQTEHHSNLWTTNKGKSRSFSAFWRLYCNNAKKEICVHKVSCDESRSWTQCTYESNTVC